MKKQSNIAILSMQVLFLCLFITCCKQARKILPFYPSSDHKVFPAPKGYVSDFEEILTEAQEEEITSMIKQHERETTDQVAIVTLTTLGPYKSIDDYSLDLANYWDVGQKGKNNGILIAFGKGMRKIRIQNGYGIEKRLTDEETKKIIDLYIIPKFKDNKYYEGLKDGLTAIFQELK